VPRVERGAIEDRILLRELVTRVAEVAERARERMNRLAELDSASEDVLVGVVRALEEQLWMIRAQIPQKG
jgi:starvation-inducible DNA-binding protein